MKDIIIFGTQGLSKLSSIKEEVSIHLLLKKGDRIPADTMALLSGKKVDMSVIDSDSDIHLGFEGGKLMKEYPEAQVIFPGRAASGTKKRHRRTKAEIERDRQQNQEAEKKETGKKDSGKSKDEKKI